MSFSAPLPNLKQQMILRISIHYNEPQMYIIITIIFLFFLTTTVVSVNSKFVACTPRSCGNGLNIKYPFWIPYEQDSFCGYPHFEITCKNKNPTLKASIYHLLVKDINYSNSSFTAANLAAYEETCPAPMHNYSFDQLPFTYSSENNNLSFFYNCTTKPIDFPIYEVDCAKNATHYSFAVFHKEALENKNYFINECQFVINVPLNMNADVNFSSLLQMNYTEILKIGFLLNWTAPDCQYCEKSGGRCGFDGDQFLCFCKDKSYLKSCGDGNHWKWIVVVIGATAAAVIAGLLSICYFTYMSPASQEQNCFPTKGNQDIETFLKNHGVLTIKRYKFSDVKKMTNSFKVKLGQGGFGVVYKGKLSNDFDVAVKMLNPSKGNGEEFINEVASISRTSHINVVALLGFCLEGHKKVLIYEFMSNGSLDNFIYKKNPKNTALLSWDNLYQISIGIARGLEYLHRGCNILILHFDIKPHNILLDENFCPKISDFGLAKLCPRKESHISMSETRGTIGYIAPEVWSRHLGRVSHKSDVYSYGMMLLEMVGMKENILAKTSHTSEMYFPDWIYKRLDQGTQLGPDDDGEVAIEENDVVKKMTIVGLWCIQTIPNDRPTMSRVVEMLEGSMNSLEMPPRPVLSSTRVVVESSSNVVSLVESSSVVSVVESSTNVT
ncbi:LEAF RUST 10 DISEASE-RESISTANCE LOCUS RECEPTOR-LIKE PROTEIN KINASE-like 2.1 isoform X2 [Arachis stenosperma]|uniref:LEAF RUST 10 DISEASE-RESISTANCE LOCUS RECEPTOR-LIKE PROTEIN KINASE-like 2.1 isoform X2 n=1 Tax=Arachis stenosperma TaxID=217475 RepID=UPI0025ABEDB5|nr:LEAF RUST 10 DISEASE-RESISTANCE LOCUS RECEPTOR-LIKE PROTEIN KINASE-like 2.1 isoform X2 [Arachis stenosperma]